MTRLLVALLATAATLLQLSVMPVLAAGTLGAPLLPIALLAAWGAMRRPLDIWPALLLVAVILGVTSQERAGWYLLALLPTGIALLAAPTEGAVSRLARAPLAGAAGGWGYLALLLVADGRAAALPAAIIEIDVAAVGTAITATALALVLWPVRARGRSLFA